MTAIRLSGIDFSYGPRRLFRFGKLTLNDGERVGLIGINGSGKSTLLDIIAGISEPSAGSVEAYMPISYFRQGRTGLQSPTPESLSAFSAEPGLENPSGGELTRLKLASAFAPAGGIILLDEPTTNLDLDGIMTLREAISDWDGPVIMVTHDAALMAETCGRIWKVKDCGIVDFPGGYEEWSEFEKQMEESAGRRYEEYLRKRRHLLRAMSESMASSKSLRKAPSRMGNSEARLHKRQAAESSEKLAMRANAIKTRLEKLERVERPRPDKELAMAFSRPRKDLPRFLAALRDLHLSAGMKPLLQGASLDLPSGMKTCLMGPNGCGKSTLVGKLADPASGYLPRGIKVGLLRQDLSSLDDSGTAVENCTRDTGATEQAARTVLARLRIRRDMALVAVGAMSGGERMKVALARIMLSDCDVMLLDEPSNHMDIESVEALSEVLSAWPGTLLMASHDRALIDAVADRLIIFEGMSLRSYEGNWSDYESSRLYAPDLEALAESMRRAEDAYKDASGRGVKPSSEASSEETVGVGPTS